MSDAFDLVILGGGCAGLSLSMALATQVVSCPRTLVVESRTQYTNDRTWCFWGDSASSHVDASHPITYSSAHPISHRWKTMRVTQRGRSVLLDCASTPYQMLAAEDFYAAACEAIDRQPNITLQLATSVIGVPQYDGNLWTLITNSGPVTARAMVDTRPSQVPRLGDAVLWQSFFGHEIECDAGVFDASTMDLMHFLDPAQGQVVCNVPFVYVLPMSSTRALVEVTVFGEAPLGPAQLSAQLDAAIAERVGTLPFAVLRSEHGILPMGLARVASTAHPSFVKVGLMAGAARPSTGYAFQRIQRWAGECAQALASGRHPVAHCRDPWPLRTMDRIFLDVLRDDPARAGALFFSLFRGTDPARIIRFLSGTGSLADCLAVVAAMPVSPFVRAAFALALRRGRISPQKSLT